MLRAVETSGRPPDAEARYNLQVGTDRARVGAALAYARELAGRMEDVARQIDIALADSRGRLEAAAAAVDRIRREQRRQEALDRNFGTSPEAFDAVVRCARAAFDALRGSKQDVEGARAQRAAAADWAREGRNRLGLDSRAPDSLIEVIHHLRATLFSKPAGEPAVEPLLLRLAQIAGPWYYALVAELSSAIDALLVTRGGASGRRRVEELLQALETGSP